MKDEKVNGDQQEIFEDQDVKTFVAMDSVLKSFQKLAKVIVWLMLAALIVAATFHFAIKMPTIPDEPYKSIGKDARGPKSLENCYDPDIMPDSAFCYFDLDYVYISLEKYKKKVPYTQLVNTHPKNVMLAKYQYSTSDRREIVDSAIIPPRHYYTIVSKYTNDSTLREVSIWIKFAKTPGDYGLSEIRLTDDRIR